MAKVKIRVYRKVYFEEFKDIEINELDYRLPLNFDDIEDKYQTEIWDDTENDWQDTGQYNTEITEICLLSK